MSFVFGGYFGPVDVAVGLLLDVEERILLVGRRHHFGGRPDGRFIHFVAWRFVGCAIDVRVRSG